MISALSIGRVRARRNVLPLTGLAVLSVVAMLWAVLAIVPAPASAQVVDTCWIVADASNGTGNDWLSTYDLTNDVETPAGQGTGTTNIEAVAYHYPTGRLFATNAGQFGEIDLTPGGSFGVFTAIGSGGLGDVDGLAFDSNTGLLWGSVRNNGSPDELIRIDFTSGTLSSTPIAIAPTTYSGSLNGGGSTVLNDIDDLAIDPVTGIFYAIANGGAAGIDVLVTIDPETGVTTSVGSPTESGFNDVEGLGFTPAGDLIGTLGSGADIVDIDLSNGAASLRNSLVHSDHESVDCLSDAYLNPSIGLEKATNTLDADTPTGPFVAANGTVTWTYVITNTGNLALFDLALSDNIEGAVTCTFPQPLFPGDSTTCTLTTTSIAVGQYANIGTIEGTPVDLVGSGLVLDPDTDQWVDQSGTPVDFDAFDPAANDVQPIIDDTDPSHYFGADPQIAIEKATNGVDADTPSGPSITNGDPVTWTYEVTNPGNVAVANVVVADDNGTPGNTADDIVPAFVGGDVNSDGLLNVGETWAYTATGVATIGQYSNDATVSGVGPETIGPDGSSIAGTPVTDEDPSHYFGEAGPAITVEKDTNGNQADVVADQDSIPVGDVVTWTFEVANTGDTDLANVAVTDTVTTDNGTAAGTVVCDWAGSSDAATPAGNLSVGETVTCESSSTAEAGQYANNAAVSGTPVDDATSANPTPLTDSNGDPLDDVTDEDPSHYFGEADPAITVEKDTNGNQADVVADQDLISAGAQVTWTFAVENTGNVDLANVAVTDTVTTNNGTAPGSIVCDWANSSDAATPAGNLSVGETVTCESSSTAELGQYANNAGVSGTPVDDATSPNPAPLTDVNGDPLDDVTDEDPSSYFGEAGPAITVEKDTNGNQADVVADQDLISAGAQVTWTFAVENTGNVDLANVAVTDTVTTDNGTVAGTVVCDWAGSSDAATPAGNLSVGETVTCTSTSTAAAGQYANNADVAGTPVDDATSANPTPLTDTNGDPLPDATDEDPSHYFGEADAAITVEKDTNGNQADVVADQDSIPVGDVVTWTFAVENTGNVDLANVAVIDTVTTDNGTVAGTIVCDWAGSSDAATPAGNLSVGETVTCTSTSTAAVGQYANNADVSGTPVDDATSADPTPLTDSNGDPLDDVTDEDPSSYFGEADAAITVEKDTNGNQADVVADQDSIAIGDPVVWTFEIENTGDTDLADVSVTDTVTTDNGTAAGTVVCDWAGSSDAATPAGNLSVGETVTCTSTSTAAAGQYANSADVAGTPVDDATSANPTPLTDSNGDPLDDVTDEDPSSYFGEADPALIIEKDTNGIQADTGPGPVLQPGDPVTWTFEVGNSGDVDLANVVVIDTVTTDNGTVAGTVVCDWAGSSDAATPAGNLSVGETVTCTSTSTAAAGQYANNADVTGTPVDDATTADPNNPTPLTDVNGDPLPDVTDDDPSHYYGEADPAITVEKDTNGNQADVVADQDLISTGAQVTWTFEVANTGNVDLANVAVTDTVTTDNGTAAGTVVCDWANSSDAATPAGNLSAGETVTCESSSTAEAGQYANNADVSGTPVDDATSPNPTPLNDANGDPLPDATDEDPSSYFGEAGPAIIIEKDTNGNQADFQADQDLIAIGDPVVWTFAVENTGNVDLANVTVTDTVTVNNGTAAGTVVCDWAGSSDAATPAGNLSVGETVTCTSTSTAAAGQYANNAGVTGTPVDDATSANPTPLTDTNGDPLPDATDDDPSHYYGEADPALIIEKDTNGIQADTGPGPVLQPGDPVTWTFEVGNSGDVDLADVSVTDTVTTDNGTAAGTVVCDWAGSSDAATPAGNLSVGETVTCTSTSTAAAGQYANNADVSGTPVDDATSANPTPLTDVNGDPLPDVTDDDPSHYFGKAGPAITVEKDTNGNQADVVADQDLISAGAQVTWTFEVANTGNVDLANVAVTDTVTTNNGTAPGTIVCDWANSSDPATPAGNLSAGETVTCESSSTAELGQYANNAEVSGTPVDDATSPNPTPLTDTNGDPLPDATDEDPSSYFGEAGPAIIIEKDTNGNQSDLVADQDSIAPGDPVVWTFVVENTGDVGLGNVAVTDTVTTDNGTVAGTIVCDWAGSSDAGTPAGNLAVGETVTCSSSSSAAPGQYANNATVSGTPVVDPTSPNPTPVTDTNGDPLPDVTNDDPSSYFGEIKPEVTVEKDTNGNQADVVADQQHIAVGDPVTWTFAVENTGNVDLANVAVTDTVTTNNGTAAGAVVCDWANSSDTATPAGNLSAGETVTCESSSTAELGQYANNATVTGTPVNDAASDNPTPALDSNGNPFPDVTDEDPSSYFGAVLDLALRKEIVGATSGINVGDNVTFTITVFNQGNVAASSIEIIDYLPAGLALSDSDWTGGATGGTYSFGDLILEPGGSTTVDITTIVTSGATGTIDNQAEITAALGVTLAGEEIQVNVGGNLVLLTDADSSPDTNNSEDAVDDAIDNASGDEDDHDTAVFTIAASPVTTNTTYTPLALTGRESVQTAVLGMLMVLGGAFLVLTSRRRRN